jgi:hypothetical protein
MPALLVSALLAASAFAADIKVENAWVRAPAPGQVVVGGFMDITSAGNAKLVSAQSPVAGTTELHEMSMKDGVMMMRPVPHIALPPGQTVKLAPGGLHLMLIDLKKPLKPGDKVPLTLRIQAGKTHQTLTVQAEVRDPMAAGRH